MTRAPSHAFAISCALLLATSCGGGLPPRATLAAVDSPADPPCELDRAASAQGPPGAVIAHLPRDEQRYVGSPSLVVLDDGSYLASHDVFGPRRFEPRQTHLYRSNSRGERWEQASVVEGQFWSSLFVHRGNAYLLGPDTGLGNVVIRRSDDGGRSWTEPVTIFAGRFHTAPVPVVLHAGRIWRAAEEMLEPVAWPQSLAALLMSAAEDADLLDPASWSRTPPLRFDPAGTGDGWMEGNAVVGPDGALHVMLRVELRDEQEQVALLRYDTERNELARESVRPFPGGSKKFTIRFDPASGRYWTLVNDITQPASVPGRIRNRLSIASSQDLREWTVHRTLLSHPDHRFHGFQYADFQFDGEDIILVSRTSYDDAYGGADDYHNANFLTFHRVRRFRRCVELRSA